MVCISYELGRYISNINIKKKFKIKSNNAALLKED